MVSPCGWDVCHGKVQVEETDGSCGREKEHDLPFFLFMEVYGLEVEDEISAMATQFW